MPRKSRNTQMFALPQAPAERIEIAGREYRLLRVFKHDFLAATCLYEFDATTGTAEAPPAIAKVVVKLGRAQPFCGFPLQIYAKMLADHEEAIYHALAGVEGVPRWVARMGEGAFAIEYVDAVPLDHLASPPPGYFERLRAIFDAIHARGVAYVDSNKRSNLLVTEDGTPFVIDFQISIRTSDDWPWPLRPIASAAVRYLSAKDIYHLYKHKRRLAPAELTEAEAVLSRSRSRLHLLHRKLAKPYRAIRRRFLSKQHAKGSLQSPTADLETHHQPEKDSWRKE